MNINIGKLIHGIDIKLKRDVDRLAAKYDITLVQHIVMERIVEIGKERDVFQRDIETGLDVRRSTVSNVIGLLEKKGFIKRESVESDARLKKLTLTGEGLDIYGRFSVELAASQEKTLATFSLDELQTLFALLNRLSESI